MPIRSYSGSRNTRHAGIFFLVAAFALLPSACGDDSTEPEDDPTITGTWTITSFQAMGTDFIAQGLGVTVTIAGSETSGTIQFSFQNDLAMTFCEEEQTTSCIDGPNPFQATASQITLDPGDPEDELTLNYAITGGGDTMTWTGIIDGIPATIVLSRQ